MDALLIVDFQNHFTPGGALPGREQPGPFRLQDARLGDLRDRGIDRLFVTGLATDYCVKNTALDARREGFDVTVVEDAERGVEVEPGDSERVLEEMERAGARVATSEEVLASRN